MDDKELIQFHNKHVAMLEKADAVAKKDWDMYYQYFIGKHWKIEDPDNPRPVTNFCRSTIRSSVALLTDNRPIVSAMPVDRNDINKANLVKRIIQNDWDRENCREKLSLVEYDAHAFGTGFWKLEWDGKDKRIHLIPPEFIQLDPFCTSVEDAQVARHFMPVPIATLKKVLSESKTARKKNLDALKGDSRMDMIIDRKSAVADMGSEPGTERVQNTEGTATQDAGDIKKSYQSEDLGKNTNASELWYWEPELGDFMVLTVAEEMVLDHKPNPNKNKRLPFVPFYNYKDSNLPWGRSHIADIYGLNRDYNVLKAAILDHIRLTGNTPWINEANSGLDVENFHNAEGGIITIAPGTKLYRDQPPAMPADAKQMLVDIKYEIDTITGINDVMTGRKPAGIQAGIAIAELQEAAQVPVREKARRMQWSLNLAAKILWDMTKRFYTEPRLIRIIEGTEVKFEEVNPKDIQNEYDIYFDVESEFGKTRSSRVESALKLYSMQLIDRKEVLDEIGLPNRDKILTRMALADAANQLKNMAIQGVDLEKSATAGVSDIQPGKAGIPPEETM